MDAPQHFDAGLRLIPDAPWDASPLVWEPESFPPSVLCPEDFALALFRSDNPAGIPALELWMQADWVPALTIWGTVKRNQVMPGLYAFFTHDARFSALCKNPSALLQTECAAAVEINISTHEQMPNYEAWAAIGLKRKIACYWGKHGVKIFVDLNVAPQFYYANLMGVPRGWKAYMTRGSVETIDWLDVEFALACERAESDFIIFVVYGGGAAVEERCIQRGWQYLPETMDTLKEMRNAQKR